MLKQKLIQKLLLTVILLGTILLVFNYPPIYQEDSVRRSAFIQAKEFLLKEEKLIQGPVHCSQRYGLELINNYHRAHMDICSGLQESNISCSVNTEYEVPRMLCRGRNSEIGMLYSNEKSDQHMDKQLIVDCNLQVYNWIPKTIWHEGALGQISRKRKLNCTTYIEHPVFILSRYDFKNIYHILEDVVTTYESLLVLDLDPINVELLIWDDFPSNNTLFQIWKTIFGKGVRILNENPFQGGTCFRDHIFNIHGDNSLLSNAGGVARNTECSSPILKSLRHFLYKSVATGAENSETTETEVKRIGFISRKQYDPSRIIGRVLTNEAEIVSYIEERLPRNWRLLIIRPEIMETFKGQVESFKALDVLIGVHGAGLANIMFMKSGSHLIEVFHGDRNELNRHYHNMCKWLGIEYTSAGYVNNLVRPTKIWELLETVISNIEKRQHKTN